MPEVSHSEIDDATLVKQAKSGDARAFGILYERYAANIYRFICAQLPDKIEAEDLTAEVFLKAWGGLSRYRERGFPFSAFLFKIARNALIDYRRKMMKVKIHSQELTESHPDENLKISDAFVKHQAHQHLWRLLGEMRENYRSVLVLRFINGLSTREISRIMGRTEGSVRVLQHRALNVLREKIGHSRDGS
jgi:RNA polymerase sigma-70 factor (ECF subfamily)